MRRSTAGTSSPRSTTCRADEEIADRAGARAVAGRRRRAALVARMVAVADLTRKGFAAGDLSTLMSPRTVITWAENLRDLRRPRRWPSGCRSSTSATRPSAPLVAEYFQRCFDRELEESYLHGPTSAMSAGAARARQQQQVEELCAAAIRALSGERRPALPRPAPAPRPRRRLPLFAPHLHPSPEHDDFGSFRGAADGLALRLAAPTRRCTRRSRPSTPSSALVFDWLEQFRVESLAPDATAGRGAQPAAPPRARGRCAFHDAGLTDTRARPAALHRRADLPRARHRRAGASRRREDLHRGHALRAGAAHRPRARRPAPRSRADQAAYAVHALSIARSVAAHAEDAGPRRARPSGATTDEPTNAPAVEPRADLDGVEDGADERFATAVASGSQPRARRRAATTTASSPPPTTAKRAPQRWCAARCWPSSASRSTAASPPRV